MLKLCFDASLLLGVENFPFPFKAGGKKQKQSKFIYEGKVEEHCSTALDLTPNGQAMLCEATKLR